jgi:hypothetical protein
MPSISTCASKAPTIVVTQSGATSTSSSVKATRSARDSQIPVLRANESPCRSSGTRRSRGSADDATASRVSSVLLLSTTITS